MIKDEIQSQTNIALKKGDKERVTVLRFLTSQIKYKEINSGKDATDDDTVHILRGEIKKLNESIVMFAKGNRNDLVDKNKKEIEIIKEFLPADLPDVEINKIIDDIIGKSELGVHPGKIIGLTISETKGKADPGKIAMLVNQKLKNK